MVEIKNTNNLTNEINAMRLSNYQRVLVYKIIKRFNLFSNDYGTVMKAINLLYTGEITLSNLEDWLKERIDNPAIDDIAKDIVGFCLLPAKDYFKSINQDIEGFLGERIANKEYTNNIETFRLALVEERNGTYDHDKYLYLDQPDTQVKTVIQEDEDVANEDFELGPQEKKAHLEKFFEVGLDDALSLEEGLVLHDINDTLIEVLSSDNNAGKELSEVLTKGQGLIGDNKIILEDKELPQTHANWLKDFLSTAGSDHFDNLSIAKYIISSDNAKKLNEPDQIKLRKFLTLYHNLKFFPAPFSSVPIDSWEVFPGANTVIGKEPIIKEAEIKETEKLQKNQTVENMSESDPELLELKNMLLQYPVGSLERAAIEEEIKNLEKK